MFFEYGHLLIRVTLRIDGDYLYFEVCLKNSDNDKRTNFGKIWKEISLVVANFPYMTNVKPQRKRSLENSADSKHNHGRSL